MLARARTLAPDNGDVSALEKLSAAEALISLQFYDEAERALAPLQSAKLAAVENALGLVYQGKLDTWRAERAFKRASELDSKWAAPHYNLALLYRSQQNQAALGGVMQDVRGFFHFHHEGGFAARQGIRRADAGKNPIDDPDARLRARHESAHLR